MIAKLVVWGSDRSEALRLLKIKLSDYNVLVLDLFIIQLMEDGKNLKVNLMSADRRRRNQHRVSERLVWA